MAIPAGWAFLALSNPLTVVVVQMEIAAKFLRGWRSRKTAATFSLRSGDRHGRREEKGLQNC